MSAAKPTIDDVAVLSGVARATVSRVLNGKPNVREEVRQRVLLAMEQLNFKVNMQARFLAGWRTQQLALVYASDFDSAPNSFYHSGLELGALRGCARAGFELSTHAVNQNSVNMAARILELVDGRRCDGLILAPPFADDLDLLTNLKARQFPAVCISPGQEAQALAPGLGIDDEAAGYELTRHFLLHGHRRFGFIKGLENHLSAEGRFDGFCRALSEAGISPDTVLIQRGNFTFRSGVELSPAILNASERPTALICANDDMAVGALFSAHKMGLSIPHDLSVAGFDDTPVSEIIWPPLTTVHQPLTLIGQRAVERIVEALNASKTRPESPQGGFEVVPHRIVVRDSTGKGAACI